MESVIKKVVTKIREERESQHITQRHLALISGVSYSTITKIETGKTKNPAFLQVVMLCKALNISIDDLIK